uniref:Uncharacterized protein n=1 Tax=Glossina brevipalpis TaxID=37001 RepID=A0A1A9WVA9_9MUSC
MSSTYPNIKTSIAYIENFMLSYENLSEDTPNIQTAARCILDDLICAKASVKCPIIKLRRDGNFCIASRIKIKTSAAANSLVSDKNSTNTGITLPATSGNLMEHECKVLTNSWRYLPTISLILRDETKSIAKFKVLRRTSISGAASTRKCITSTNNCNRYSPFYRHRKLVSFPVKAYRPASKKFLIIYMKTFKNRKHPLKKKYCNRRVKQSNSFTFIYKGSEVSSERHVDSFKCLQNSTINLQELNIANDKILRTGISRTNEQFKYLVEMGLSFANIELFPKPATSGFTQITGSDYSKTWTGVYASTLGALSHELRHRFDLSHAQNGVMGTGFDFINRVFTLNTTTEHLSQRIVAHEEKKEIHATHFTKFKKPTKCFLDNYRQPKENDSFYFTNNYAIILIHNSSLKNDIQRDFLNS